MKTLQRRNMLVAGTILLLAIVMVVAIGNSFYSIAEPCRPIGYSDGEKLDVQFGLPSFQETPDSLTSVLQFYDNELNARVVKSINDNWNQDEWIRVKINSNEYTYQCLTNSMSKLFQYEGCIHIHEESSGIIIEKVLYRFEEAAFDCNDPLLRD